jgi:NAD(P)-dependent dehydrogenase (short-subunit alcohol dehydrogenase family)
VNVLSPGPTVTAGANDIAARAGVEDLPGLVVPQVPLARLGDPDEMAALAVFALSARRPSPRAANITSTAAWCRSGRGFTAALPLSTRPRAVICRSRLKAASSSS